MTHVFSESMNYHLSDNLVGEVVTADRSKLDHFLKYGDFGIRTAWVSLIS